MDDVSKLQTVANFAKNYKRKNGSVGVTTSYVYKMIVQGKIDTVIIDDVTFIKIK